MITSPDIPLESKVRLSILYALRYQKFNQNNIPGVVELLKQQNVPDSDVSCSLSGQDERRLTETERNDRWFTAYLTLLELINVKTICLRMKTFSVEGKVR